MFDYRFTNFEKYNYSDVKQQKNELGKEIDEKAISNIGLHYDKIKPKESKYYEKFEEIYYHKCAYCGVSTAINPASLYEIDHFFNELQTTFGSDNLSVDIIDNLILSCRNCNQSKKEFAVNDVHSIIHPDSREIKEVFNRGEHFEIKIAPQYCKDEKIQSFYNMYNVHDALLLLHVKSDCVRALHLSPKKYGSQNDTLVCLMFLEKVPSLE